MPVHNQDIAGIFNKTADMLELKGENPFRIRAYRTAARTVGGLSGDVGQMINQGRDLSELPGVGKDLAGKIGEIVATGTFPALKKLEKELPGHLHELMSISGLGGKKVKKIHEELNVKTVRDLEQAARKQKVRRLPGFGAKTEENILQGIERVKTASRRIKLSVAEQYTRDLVKYLKKDKKIKQIAVAGSNRRKKATVRDADILVTCSSGSTVMDRFVKYGDVKKVVSKGETRSTVRLRSDFQVDLRVMPQVSYGSALLYFTGSKAHNIALRKIAIRKKYKLNEYGLFKGDRRRAGRTEEEVYKKLGLPYIEPELREDRGEIEAGRKDRLPALITRKDIRGDLHTHTKATDGHNTLKEMAEAARGLGYDYIADTEHTKQVRVAGGLNAEKMREQIEEVKRVNKKLKKFTILRSAEVDILEDGSLDLPDDILKDLDLTVCSVHSKFNLPAKRQTERIIRAMDNKYFTILGHPTGRRINERPPYEADMDKLLKAAHERGVVMEINAHPERQDLDDVHCRAAKRAGCKLSVATDAHSVYDLELIPYGINQARRGWLEADDVVNTRSLKQLRKWLKRR